ncbi:AI-2E family transporter [Mycolicibacterium arabiense]|uniref:AI-2E family transporter n=1 Tax=Mycolicibacterium arabiense TaxID=1286181 RepID=A0A7I7RZE6_9MYCO|nr:AI-2E family transporter [Mycolicibacterium arabiense]MBJ7384457.1 AI-2E family transporter [Mycolicibacterium sp.]MCV7374323.1 AI-2E family transporter [Mycolicibacterium arabiense]BBY49581.1 AI-2E family transporter [Mycolicibacterium arabiense]
MTSAAGRDDQAVHPLVRAAAAWSWRLLVIGAAAYALLWLLQTMGVVVVSIAIALILTALLLPAVDFLDRYGAVRGGAVAFVMVLGLAILTGVMSFVVNQFVDGAPQLVDEVTRSIEGARAWLINGPADLSRDQINQAGDTVIDSLRDHQAQLTTGALSTAGTIAEILTGALLCLFTVIFFLLGGRNIWEFVTRLIPRAQRARVREAGAAGFHSLAGYARATSLVALVDAVAIGSGLAIMGIPLALPLASLIFLGAFVPVVGALVTGFLAVIVALLAKGIVYALITLALIIAVMQLEAHVLQPLVMGRAVSLHPLAVVIGITAGGVLAGVIGALLVVPAIAFFNSFVRVLAAQDPDSEADSLDDEDGPLVDSNVDDPGPKR